MKRGFSNVHCPKCNGNIFFENAEGEGKSYEELTGWCLQCGYTMYPKKDKMNADELMAITSDINHS